MTHILKLKEWNPYLSGLGIGILAASAPVVSKWFLASERFLGTTSTLNRMSAYILNYLFSDWASKQDYFIELGIKIDWGFALLVGVILGSLLAAWLGRDVEIEWMPSVWQKRFGTNNIIRAFIGFIGGVLIICGARIAGGCTSGHGLTGVSQLSMSSFIAVGTFILSGMITARLLYRK